MPKEKRRVEDWKKAFIRIISMHCAFLPYMRSREMEGGRPKR